MCLREYSGKLLDCCVGACMKHVLFLSGGRGLGRRAEWGGREDGCMHFFFFFCCLSPKTAYPSFNPATADQINTNRDNQRNV